MKKTLLLPAVCMISACVQTPKDTIVGKWYYKSVERFDNIPVVIKGVCENKIDNTFEEIDTISAVYDGDKFTFGNLNNFRNNNVIFKLSGTWKIKDDLIIGTCTESNSGVDISSLNYSNKIIKLTKDLLITEDEEHKVTTSNRILELKKGELDGKQKELDLKENEPSHNTTQTGQKSNNDIFYIINVNTVKTESEAKVKVAELKNQGNSAGYLWIPDYASLSGAQLYSIYIGPFSTQHDCEVATEGYRKKQPNAYGLLVSQDKKRVQINGIGKVIINDNTPSYNVNISVESFTNTALPKKFKEWWDINEYGVGVGGVSEYSKIKGGEDIFMATVGVNPKAVMKINDRFIELLYVESKDAYIGDGFEVKIEITKSTPAGVESIDEEGYMTITMNNGNSVKIKIWGGSGV
jgi:hypothetical protein